ncbi:MAG: 2-hydroxyacid dehydrogenase [Hyphomonadaceae bacterium]|nr:2-hydroxyacid dehydrogenase [Hyphomonadaceae bacterium]
MTKPLVLVHPPLGLFELQLASFYEVLHWPTDRKDVTAAITVGSTGLSNAMIDALPALKSIICFGVGVDGLDLSYCRQRGVAVSYGPNINNEDVADVAIGLIIAVARGFTLGERVLREGKWAPPMPIPPQKRLRGRKLGIVGMGSIGQAIAARAEPFGLEIKWTGPRAKPEVKHGYEPDLLALAQWADILALCPRADKSTEGLVSAAVIEALGGDGMLINVSRGSVVDEAALIAALKAGKLGAAGLDVFVEEPTPVSRWADVPNVTLLPHLGGLTSAALFQGAQNVLENLRRHFAGEPLATPVPDTM